MKVKLFVWLFFIVSAQTILILSVECFTKPSISTQNIQGQKVPASYAGLNKTAEFSENTIGRLAYTVTRKGSKGKGAFGGANVVHRPRRPRNAALSSAAPSFLVFSVMLATFSLICPCHL
ncbi:hypothetical protein BT93_F2179 [Corymbia citriodora subsp. variegata]|nr:hypothetical protein BT93_F2179 [Corymbia citriodora subsp. variegata]